MPRAEPVKRAEARRLVEGDGLSLAAAADRVGVNRGTVRQWQKADEARGKGWAFRGSNAEAAPARMARTEPARRVTRARWADRRGEEAEHQGTLAGGMRLTSAEALTRCRQAIAASDADTTVKWARALRDLAVTGGIHADKADRLADIPTAASVVALEDTYQDDLAEVLSLVDRIDAERRSG